MSIKDEIYKIADEIFLSDPDQPLEKKLKLVSLTRVEAAYHAQGKAPPSSRTISVNLKSWRHEKKSAPLENPQSASAMPEIEEIPPPLPEELTMPEESSPHSEAYPQITVTTTTTTTSLQEECPLVVPPAEMEAKWQRLYSDVVCQQNKDIDSLKQENQAIASDLNAIKSQYETLFYEKASCLHLRVK